MVLAPLAAIPWLPSWRSLAGWAGCSAYQACWWGSSWWRRWPIATRGLHLDGLADTFDGLGATGSRERALAIMKRGDIGPMGAVALIVVLALRPWPSVPWWKASRSDHRRPGGVLLACRAPGRLSARGSRSAGERSGGGRLGIGAAPGGLGVWLSAQVVLVAAAALSARWWLGLFGGVL